MAVAEAHHAELKLRPRAGGALEIEVSFPAVSGPPAAPVEPEARTLVGS
jgi:hypothetical protein